MINKDLRIIVVTGGVLSGLGKGIAAASIGRLLKDTFNKIVTVKCDGYLNVDPGTMNPIEHGEVFVLDDGGEVDMDFGHYERFLNINTKFNWNLTSGKMFMKLIERERKGDFLGKTIQIFPHMPMQVIAELNTIINTEEPDLLLIEIGGTIGDIENAWFIEAVRRLKKQYTNQMSFVHLTYITYLDNVGEFKTKPAQQDIARLRRYYINPDIVIARSKSLLPERIKDKLAIAVDIDRDKIISAKDVSLIYDVPMMFYEQDITKILSKTLNKDISVDMTRWKDLLQKARNPEHTLNILIAGKYTYLKDSYASVIEALFHAATHLNTRLNLKWLETSNLEDDNIDINTLMKDIDAVVVPGGFGKRGVEGKIQVIQYAREKKIPYLGLCYGLQLAVIEFARNICSLNNASSTEFDSNAQHNVVDLLDEQRNVTKLGATMRLGSYSAIVNTSTITASYYHRLGLLYPQNDKQIVFERHRHRYEVNPEYHQILREYGMIFSGLSEDGLLAEFIELPKDIHPYFVATQSHPELKSRFEKPAPLFLGLIENALKHKRL